MKPELDLVICDDLFWDHLSIFKLASTDLFKPKLQDKSVHPQHKRALWRPEP